MPNDKQVRHILSLSGGKDSAALAVYMRDRVPEMEYIFHDGGKELPETYDYLARLESILEKPIQNTAPREDFDHWMTVFGNMIPSNHRRWCTRMLKLKPFEDFIGDDPVVNYVGLRADEPRTGYISTKPNIKAVYPFREDGLVYKDIVRILEDSGLGLPTYTNWGRTRSGCFFCFYQQKIEWVRLKQNYPDLYDEAKRYEALGQETNGRPFYWSASESLEEIEQPERMAEIEREWQETQERRKAQRGNLPLVHILGGKELPDEPEERGCLICSL